VSNYKVLSQGEELLKILILIELFEDLCQLIAAIKLFNACQQPMQTTPWTGHSHIDTKSLILHRLYWYF
jgi:hypothetical protein